MEYQKIERRLAIVRNVVCQNLAENYVPFPMNKAVCSAWTKDLPRAGNTIIYTSYMYQLGSAFKSYARLLDRFSSVGAASRFASLGGLLVKPKKGELERASHILNRIVVLLRNAGVEVAYLYDQEPYSGAILLELGLLDEFQEYGKKVFALFQSLGVQRVVTVDPHSTNALTRLKTFLRSDLEVVNYFQLVQPTRSEGSYVMHDSCLYSRYLGLGPTIKSFLQLSGVNLVDGGMVTAQETSTCCGAPVEAVDEKMSERIARRRAEKLVSVNKDVLVACPLCFQNLSPYVESMHDVAEVI